MKDWVLSQEGAKWSVEFDVRDLGGHLDTTFRGWSSTLAARVRLVISRLVLIFALLLDFHGRVRIVRSMFLPAAIHGIEASVLASDSLRKLRSSIHRVVWTRRQPLACVGAVLGLLMFVGLTVCLRWLVRVLLVMVLSIFSLQVLLRLVFGGILMLWHGLVPVSSTSQLGWPSSAFQGCYS